MKRTVLLCCWLFLILSFLGCVSRWTPPEGSWFCEELQLQVSFVEGESFYILNGAEIPCDSINNRGSHSFFVISQAKDIKELPLGTELFSAVYMEFTETYMIATEEHTKEEFIFLKVE